MHVRLHVFVEMLNAKGITWKQTYLIKVMVSVGTTPEHCYRIHPKRFSVALGRFLFNLIFIFPWICILQSLPYCDPVLCDYDHHILFLHFENNNTSKVWMKLNMKHNRNICNLKIFMLKFIQITFFWPHSWF